ncbi:FAD binding domain-containing protein [Gordonia westfalica]|uniref:FAD binding domain-containing protein n=1 Tax=Gordonia westfalica TaxID=158898 RepID=A0A1H2IZP0_9ACTN|nr:FAD-binding protein [Gordonia westfalica]SDU49664.1 FAD binding domain-containing protein [Gordonia westfalica]
MTTLDHGIAAALEAALPHRVHRPDSAGYRDSLARIFFPDASRRRPPRVDDGAVLLDLSSHLSHARPCGTLVETQGGATVGSILDSLADSGRVIPVGIVGLAGLGLVTRGGVGYLTRSVGLTLDHLVEVELILPDGEIVRLYEDSTGDDADLWWAVRGCAPSFGVVTEAVMRTHEQGPVHVDRAVVELDALPHYFAVAPTLPRHTTMGAVLGYAVGAAEPAVLVYTATPVLPPSPEEHR